MNFSWFFVSQFCRKIAKIVAWVVRKNHYKLYGCTYIKYIIIHNVCAKCFCEGAMSIAVEVKLQQLQPVLKEQDSDLHENCSQENKRPTALNSALLFTANDFHIESWHPLHLTIKENKSVSSRTELLKIGLRNSALNWWVCFLNHASAWNKEELHFVYIQVVERNSESKGSAVHLLRMTGN